MIAEFGADVERTGRNDRKDQLFFAVLAVVAFLVSCYQASLKPNCAARPSSAVVMTPAVAFEMLPSGLPKLL